MRFSVTLLIGYILFLSCFPGLAQKAAASVRKDNCCKTMKMVCRHPIKEKKPADGCGQTGCAMMFSCNICGFFVKEPLTMQPVYANLLPKPVAYYIIDNLVGYHPDDWKPPQVC